MPATMGKRRSKETESDETVKTDRHKNPVVSLRPPPSLRAALERKAQEQRRSLAQTIQLILEKAMEDEGRWSPPGPDA
jgi:hypothetical protein